MKRRMGPILHLRQAKPSDWRFAVGLWVEKCDIAALRLSFPELADLTITPAATPGAFNGADWVYWDVTIPRQSKEFRTTYRIEGLEEGPVEVDGVCIPGIAQSPRISFFSCNGVQDPRKWTSQPEMEVLWERMRERHVKAPAADGSGGPYHVLIGGGDQIYADSVWLKVPELEKLDTWKKREKAKASASLTRNLERHYGDLYARWHKSWFADLHSRVPGLYIWDDHDIFDGFGSYSDALQGCPVYQSIFAQARSAFSLFQLGGGNPCGGPCVDPTGSHFMQTFSFDESLDILILDLRAERTSKQVMSQAQWKAIGTYLSERAARTASAAHLLVVSSIPLVYLNFSSAEAFADWLPWRQDLEDDLRDQWESAAHQEERARLIMTLLDHAKATSTRVSVLSGDVHVGARARITSTRPAHLLPGETESVIHQLTSSAIVYPAPGALALAGMRAIGGKGPSPVLSVSHVDTEVIAVSADHYLLGARNWLSIEPARSAQGAGTELWIRWITEKGDVKPPIVVHAR